MSLTYCDVKLRSSTDNTEYFVFVFHSVKKFWQFCQNFSFYNLNTNTYHTVLFNTTKCINLSKAFKMKNFSISCKFLNFPKFPSPSLNCICTGLNQNKRPYHNSFSLSRENLKFLNFASLSNLGFYFYFCFIISFQRTLKLGIVRLNFPQKHPQHIKYIQKMSLFQLESKEV